MLNNKQLEVLASTAAEAARRFFADPANVEQYEKWLKEERK